MNQKIPQQLSIIYTQKENYHFRYDFIFSNDVKDWIRSRSRKYDNKLYRLKLAEKKAIEKEQ